MGIYSWVGAWNLNRQQHCSGQVLHGGQTGCMLGNSGGAGVGEREQQGWEQGRRQDAAARSLRLAVKTADGRPIRRLQT